MKILTKQQIQNIEQNAAARGLEYIRMMENAGSAAAKRIGDSYPVRGARAVVLCGKGNNGGDGFVVARKLHDAGAHVTILLAEGPPATEEAKQMHSRANNKIKNILEQSASPKQREQAILSADLVVDAVHGTGFHGEIGAETAALFETVNRGQAVRIALDLPSGVECDTGRYANGSFIADYTLSFIALKPSHILKPACRLCGEVEALAIGISETVLEMEKTEMFLLDQELVREEFEPRASDANKGMYGRPLLICGSAGMAGAAKLSALGALRSGAGVVRLAVTKALYYGGLAASLTEPVFTLLPATEDGGIAKEAYPEIEKLLPRAAACLIGPGMGENEDTKALVSQLIKNSEIPLVIDADGLNCLSAETEILKTAKAPVILTPHPGEMARMTGLAIEEIQADRIKAAKTLAQKVNAIVVLKGEGTVVALPGGEVYINTTGNPGMATGGSGDVLSGMIVSLLGQGLTPAMAAACAVYLHGEAGDRAAARLSQHAMLPSDLLRDLCGVFLELER